MISYDLFKNQQLIDALDEPFDFFYLIMRISANFCKNNGDGCIQKKTLEVALDFLQSGFFKITTHDGKQLWNITPEESITTIKHIWDASSIDNEPNIDDPNMWIYFALTDEGKFAAKQYWLKHIHTREKILLLAAKRPYINFYDLIHLVKQIFDLMNVEDIQSEIITILTYLCGSEKLVEIGDLHNQSQFTPWRNDFRNEISKRWNAAEGEPKNNIGILRITQHAQKLIDDWHVKDRRFIEHWYKLIDKP